MQLWFQRGLITYGICRLLVKDFTVSSEGKTVPANPGRRYVVSLRFWPAPKVTERDVMIRLSKVNGQAI